MAALTITHPFVSTVPDVSDTSLVRPSDWNDDHTVVGDSTATSGYVLIGQGVGVAPIWSSSFPGIITFPDGSAAAPSIRFTSEATGLFLQAAGSLGFSILGVEELRLTASALSPGTSDGNALGTTSLMWSDLFLASGGVINWNAGDVTLTHSTDTLTLSGDTLASLVFAHSGTLEATTPTAASAKFAGGVGINKALRVAGAIIGSSSGSFSTSLTSRNVLTSGDFSAVDCWSITDTGAGGLYWLFGPRAGSANADLFGIYGTALRFTISSSTGQVSVLATTASTSTTTGALVVAGGVGVAGALNVGGNIASSAHMYVPDTFVYGWGSGFTTYITGTSSGNTISFVTGGTTRAVINGAGDFSTTLPFLALSGTAIPAGGTAGSGYKFSSTANFGMFFGSGAPSLSAAKGSIYLRSDGSTTNDRAYINTDGSTTWTALTTVA